MSVFDCLGHGKDLQGNKWLVQLVTSGEGCFTLFFYTLVLL